MKVIYYPGCTIKRNAIDYEKKAVEILRKIGIEVYELPDWYCCGVLYSTVRDDVAKHIGGLRTLIRAQATSRTYNTNKLLTLCPMCYNVLKRINSMARTSPENLETLTLFMDDEERYSAAVEVIHLLEVLREYSVKLKTLVTSKLEGTVVAPYYGCTLVRPREIAFDNAESPESMDIVLKALGVEVVDFPFKTECCGSYMALVNREVAFTKPMEILEEAAIRGANTIATVCPLCHYNLNRALRTAGKKINVNVVYLTDILSSALGV